MALFRKDKHKYRIGQFIFYRSSAGCAGGVIVEFHKDRMKVDVREGNVSAFPKGTAHWFLINDSDWSES